MKLVFRTWNLNFWRDRYIGKPKSNIDMYNWLETGKNIITKEWIKFNEPEMIRFWLLQESSIEMYDELIYSPDYSNMVRYYELHKAKQSGRIDQPWGLIIESMQNKSRLYDVKKNPKGLYCVKTELENGITLVIINVHTQIYTGHEKNYSVEYYKTLKNEIIPSIENILKKERNNLIILGGDFNMNRNYIDYDGVEKYNGQILFDKIEKELKLIDCTRGTDFYDMSTMIDPLNTDKEIKNDYFFINEEYYKYLNKEEVIIDRYDDEYYTDHFFVEISINL